MCFGRAWRPSLPPVSTSGSRYPCSATPTPNGTYLTAQRLTVPLWCGVLCCGEFHLSSQWVGGYGGCMGPTNRDANPVVTAAVLRILSIFGVSRCFFASNYPVDILPGQGVRAYIAVQTTPHPAPRTPHPAARSLCMSSGMGVHRVPLALDSGV